MTVEHLKLLKVKKEQIRKQILAVTKDTYPIGHIISFFKWGGYITVEVLDHSDSRLYIENLVTGKRYWIDTYYLLKDK